MEIGNLYEKVKRKYALPFDLKDKQLEIMKGIINGVDVIGVLSTGYGKSLCYVLPPLLLDEADVNQKHTAIVISPLKTLMLDQVEKLKEYGISVAAVMEGTEIQQIQGMIVGCGRSVMYEFFIHHLQD